ncbi:MAG TPA: M1 family aminopeptidase, partial [Blastocatellia bacterium]|nr:M1 family aminopeptidase [Blastocatellia bacterium]
ATVTMKALKQTQSAVLEMNGSLTVNSVKAADGKTALQFIQDKVNELNVKVNLGKLYEVNTEITLTFDYSGPLATPEGGPLPDTRLAYVGPEQAYLFYAARWFPFHGYAADRATSEISITVPKNWTVAGHSSNPVTPVTGKDGRPTFTFVETQPVLPGSFAAGQFITRTINAGGMQIDVFVLPGSENRAQEFGQEVAQIFQFYNTRFGPYAYGNRYVVAQVDDETLDNYSAAGITFLPHKTLAAEKSLPIDQLAREVAYQWWGQAVGLKNFDDAWLSQGLAEYSSLLYRESQETAAEFRESLAEMIELALAYEQEASIARAPAQLNDQSPAYKSVVFYKGAYVYHMLRGTIGDDKFFNLLKTYYSTYKGQNANIDDFEALADKVTGQKLRGFFGMWVDSTGVPEFKTEYTILRTKEGKFRVRGTVRQNMDSFRGPVTVAIESEGGRESKDTLDMRGTSADFDLATEGKPLEVVVDPENRYLRTSDALKVGVVVRRGIQAAQREEYAEAEEQYRQAIKLSPRSSLAWYNLGLLYMEQRNWQKARDAFTQALDGDLEPSWIEVWSYIKRGNTYDADDNRERAVAEYDKAISNGNDYNGAQKAAERYKGQPYKKERASQASN